MSINLKDNIFRTAVSSKQASKQKYYNKNGFGQDKNKYKLITIEAIDWYHQCRPKISQRRPTDEELKKTDTTGYEVKKQQTTECNGEVSSQPCPPA